MDKLALQIAANPTVVNTFGKIERDVPGNYFIREPVVRSQMLFLLDSYNFKRDSNSRVFLYNDWGDFIYSASVMTTNSACEAFLAGEDFEKTKQSFSQEGYYVRYKPPQADDMNDSPTLQSPDYFSVIRKIKDYSSASQGVGYVEVQQSVEKIDEFFTDLGEDCYAVMLNENGGVAYKSVSMRNSGEGEAILQRAVEMARKGALQTGIQRIDRQVISYNPLSEINQHVLFVKDEDAVLAPLNQFRTLFSLACAVILIVVIVTELLIVSHLSKPLVELNRSVKNVTIDNLHMDMVGENAMDEIQSLSRAFDKMLCHLKVAIDERVESRTDELKSHLFALQSQMNPHFLYNILAVISLEAQTLDNQKIPQMCQSLSKMLSYSSKMGTGLASVEEELSHANNYLILMKERYESDFSYGIDMLPEMKNVEIPKLIVQPICENCFMHAFKNVEPVWKIEITADTRDDWWFIEITDNGSGFDRGALEKFEEMARSVTLDDAKEQLSKLSIGGLCMPNIYMRLKLCYGDEMVFQIKNEETGSTVRLGGKLK